MSIFVLLLKGCRLDDRASLAIGLDMRSFAASHQDITVSFFSFVIHSVLLKLCMCVFLTKNKRTTYYCMLIKLFWMNATMRDKSSILNFAIQVGFINGISKLVDFWFGRNQFNRDNSHSAFESNGNEMC